MIPDHISYSRVDMWLKCPKKYKFKYVDKIRTETELTPDSPSILGKAFDLGTQYGYKAAEEYYLSQFPIITDTHVFWLMQIEYWLPKIAEYVNPEGRFQVEVRKEFTPGLDYLGYIDYLDKDKLIDFKFSNNGDLYAASPQVILYADCLEEKPKELMYICAPKTFIRQKKDETIQQFRNRLKEELAKKQLDIRKVQYSEDVVKQFKTDTSRMLNDTEFIPIVSDKCKWCEYKDRCEAVRKH